MLRETGVYLDPCEAVLEDVLLFWVFLARVKGAALSLPTATRARLTISVSICTFKWQRKAYILSESGSVETQQTDPRYCWRHISCMQGSNGEFPDGLMLLVAEPLALFIVQWASTTKTIFYSIYAVLSKPLLMTLQNPCTELDFVQCIFCREGQTWFIVHGQKSSLKIYYYWKSFN